MKQNKLLGLMEKAYDYTQHSSDAGVQEANDILDEALAIVRGGAAMFKDPNRNSFISFNDGYHTTPYICLDVSEPEIVASAEDLEDARAILARVDEHYGGGKFNWTSDVTNECALALATRRAERQGE
jgi:hypothetical protein